MTEELLKKFDEHFWAVADHVREPMKRWLQRELGSLLEKRETEAFMLGFERGAHGKKEQLIAKIQDRQKKYIPEDGGSLIDFKSVYNKAISDVLEILNTDSMGHTEDKLDMIEEKVKEEV